MTPRFRLGMNRPSVFQHRHACTICARVIKSGSLFLSVCSKKCSNERIRRANISLAERKREAREKGEKFVPRTREHDRPLTMLLWEAKSGMEGWR